eukprot:scaffold84337_cov39-Phaeocystis_antarctica.AAC.1
MERWWWRERREAWLGSAARGRGRGRSPRHEMELRPCHAARAEIARAAPALQLGGVLLQLVEQHLEGYDLEPLLEQLLG